MENTTRYIIVGGSAAGPKAASKIRRLDPTAEITIIQKGKYLSMASCGYPYYVGGVFDDRNMLISTPTGTTRDPSFFAKTKGITALVETEVIKIDREKKQVTSRNNATGETGVHAYDRLILTTGATPIVPKLPGRDLKGITTLQSMEDADYLKEVVRTKSVKKAAIIGGGLIGIETCEALQLAGVEITIVEMLDQLLPFLDWEMAKLVENHIVSKGVKVVTGNALAEFVGKDGTLTGVRLADGTEVACEMAVVAIGVRPNTSLASDAGIKIGEAGGISVNRFMQTNDPDIYAAGDCCEITNLITHNKQHFPMGDAANLQGRVAAQNAVFGNIEEYEGVVGTAICKVFDFSAGCSGLSENAARKEGYANMITAIHASPDKPGFMGAKPIVIKMIADKTTGKFLGMQCVGLGEVAMRVTMGAMALQGRFSIADMVNLDLPYAPPYSPAIDNFIQAVHVLENKWRRKMVGISSVEVKRRIDAGEKPFLLDVRSPQEFEEMRLGVGEINVPLGKCRETTDFLPKNKDTEIITYCKISLRGYEAACFLTGMGYTDVKVMEGGLIAWPFPREK